METPYNWKRSSIGTEWNRFLPKRDIGRGNSLCLTANAPAKTEFMIMVAAKKNQFVGLNGSDPTTDDFSRLRRSRIFA